MVDTAVKEDKKESTIQAVTIPEVYVVVSYLENDDIEWQHINGVCASLESAESLQDFILANHSSSKGHLVDIQIIATDFYY